MKRSASSRHRWVKMPQPLLSAKPSATACSRIKVTGMTSSDLVLWNTRVIDGRNRAPQDRMCVSVRDGKIAEVRAVHESNAPSGALDLNGRFVMPGLIDAHIHLTADPAMWGEMAGPEPRKGEEPRARELIYFALANSARAFLRFGITTIRDVGCHDDNALVLREAIRLGLTEGPRILSCGRILSATAPGARLFKTMYEEVGGPRGGAPGGRVVSRHDRARPVASSRPRPAGADGSRGHRAGTNPDDLP